MLISRIYHGYEGIAVFKCIYLCEIILNAKQTKRMFRVWLYFGCEHFSLLRSFRVFFVSLLLLLRFISSFNIRYTTRSQTHR